MENSFRRYILLKRVFFSRNTFSLWILNDYSKTKSTFAYNFALRSFRSYDTEAYTHARAKLRTHDGERKKKRRATIESDAMVGKRIITARRYPIVRTKTSHIRTSTNKLRIKLQKRTLFDLKCLPCAMVLSWT